MDDEILQTLQAIHTKDPRIYDKHHTFYRTQTRDDEPQSAAKARPVNLQEYHRRNLLHGPNTDQHESQLKPTHAQEQDTLKRELVRQIHADSSAEEGEDESDDELLKAKARTEEHASVSEPPSVTRADEDPEAFLAGLMASRAWVPGGNAQMHPFESDDDEDEDDADEFEAAYNMRFEDPERANEKLRSHSRKAAEQFSVRREQLRGRRKTRDVEKLRREAEKQEREDEKARLRNLRVEQAHQKLQQLKEAAGLMDNEIPLGEWSNFLEAAFDGDKWDEEFQKRFGARYYAQNDDFQGMGRGDGDASKPTWTDDIDIDDLVPDFDDGRDAHFSLSEGEGSTITDKKRSNNDSKTFDDRANRKRRSRKEHQRIEEMVDADIVAGYEAGRGPKRGPFRYRATSPTSYGLRARDILLADDRDLNQYHGLKKLASFRDEQRKEKDRRRMDKKKLQKWRKETFGDRRGPSSTFQDLVQRKLDPEALANPVPSQPAGQTSSLSKKRRKRSKKGSGDGAPQVA